MRNLANSVSYATYGEPVITNRSPISVTDSTGSASILRPSLASFKRKRSVSVDFTPRRSKRIAAARITMALPNVGGLPVISATSNALMTLNNESS